MDCEPPALGRMDVMHTLQYVMVTLLFPWFPAS